jgi:hypothetical protein
VKKYLKLFLDKSLLMIRDINGACSLDTVAFNSISNLPFSNLYPVSSAMTYPKIILNIFSLKRQHIFKIIRMIHINQ